MSTIQIYGLVCPVEKRVKYIGKSKNASKRFYQHLYRSKNEIHYENTHLHRWLKKLHNIGLAPSLSILETTTIENWIEREKYWISYFGLNNLCNMNGGGFEPPDPTGRIWSEKTRRRYSKSRKDKSIWSDKRPHPALGKPSPLRGKKHSPEFCEKIRLSKQGKINPLKGKKLSEERINLIRKANSKPIVQIKENNQIVKIFDSMKQAAQELKLDDSAISRVCKGEYTNTHGYKFRYK